jgi:hypothetical protein
MTFDLSKLDEQVEKLRKGDTLSETEVKALCEKVRRRQYQIAKISREVGLCNEGGISGAAASGLALRFSVNGSFAVA